MSARPDVSILIVSYNTRSVIVECLHSLFAETTATRFEVIVVDNASTDGSADAVEAEFGDRVALIRSDLNLGFAAANNVAGKQARGRWILLLNPDTFVLQGAIDALVSFAEDQPDHQIYGGRTLFEDGSLNPGSCWRRMTTWGLICQAAGLSRTFRGSALFNPEGYGGWLRDLEREIDIVSGCFLLIRRELWRRLGGFSSEFFMYGEDADLCLRARDYGARPRINPNATIIHYGGASEPVKADKLVRLLTAKRLLIQRHWGAAARPLGLALLAAWPLSRALAASIRRSREVDPWREVWRRRREWLAAWPEAETGPAAPVPSVEGADVG